MNERAIIILFIILGGLFLVSTQSSSYREGFTINSHKKCPTRLVKHQGRFYMKTPKNTVEFDSLREYKYFVKALRHKGIRCPVLYAETIQDAQGDTSVRRVDDPETQTTGLMPINADNVVKTNGGLSNYSRRKDMTILNEKSDAFNKNPDTDTDSPKPFDPQNQEE